MPALAERKLAKRLVDPDLIAPQFWSGPSWVLTDGPAVAELAASAGMVPDPEQELALDLLFAVDKFDRCAVFEFDLIAARQQMKTGLILMAEIGWLYVTDERLVVHSAHELGTTEEAFVDMKALITNTPHLSRRLEAGPSNGIFEGNGRWQIRLATGQRLRYRARTKGGGRGLTGNKVVLDEGFALMPSHMGALLPTLTSVPNPQVLTASSGAKPESAVLRDKRDRGRAGASPRQGYLEWCDPHPWTGCKSGDKCSHAKSTKGCALDDEARWAKVLTALGRRCTLETVRAMRQAMPPEEFGREFMVWHDEGGALDSERAIDLVRWGLSLTDADARLTRAVIGIDVAPGMGSSSVTLAGSYKGRTLVLVRPLEGTAGIVKLVKKLRRRLDVVEVALAAGDQTKALRPRLTKAGVEFHLAKDLGAACGGFVAAANESQLWHVGQLELDNAVATAVPVGTSERPDRRDRTVDLTPFVSAAVAVDRWAAHDSDDYDVEDSYL